MKPGPEIRELRAFVKVAELGSISHAALALGIAQPSISRIVSSLEKSLGGPLFHRTGRGMELTEVGKATLPKAKAILFGVDQLATDARESASGLSGTVTLAILPVTVGHIAGELYQSVRQAHPGITLRLLEGFSGQIEEWLADGRADVGLLSRYKQSRAAGERVVRSSYLAVVSAPGSGHELPRTSIPFRELARLPLVLPASPNALRLAMEDEARRLRMRLLVVAEADSLEAQRSIIKRESCCAVLGMDSVQKEVERGLLQSRKIIEPQIPRLLVVATTQQRPLNRATREVAKILGRLASSA